MIVAPWDASAYADLSSKQRLAAYFLWHQRTKSLCAKLGVSMPVRIKRPKALSEAEKIERLRERNAVAQSKRKDLDKIRHAAYHKANRVKIAERRRMDRLRRPDDLKKINEAWKEANPDKIQAAREYSRSTAVRIRLNTRHKIREKTDRNYRMRRHLRAHMHWCIKAYGRGKWRKSASVIALVGCSIPQFILHLESLWLPGMTWANYGLKGWHIDHRHPCKAFDLSDPIQQKICFHHDNLQPMWATENHRKGARLDWPKERMQCP